MKPENIAQLLTIQRGGKVVVSGFALMKHAQTEEEKAAARAFRRVLTGTVVLTLALTLGLAIIVPMCLISGFPPDNQSRTGTVQEDGRVRYIQNEARFLTLEELGLEVYGLQPGEKVNIYFDTRTDEITEAYPQIIVQQSRDSAFGVLLGYMVLMVVFLLIYGLVICRLTPFGSAWTRYCKKQQGKEEKLPLKARIVTEILAVMIAIVICWPSIQSLVANMTKGRDIREAMETASELKESSAEMADRLETVGDNIDIEEEAAKASEAAERIRDILDSLRGK